MTDPVREAAILVVARAAAADPWWQVTNPAVAKLRAAIIALAEMLVENPPHGAKVYTGEVLAEEPAMTYPVREAILEEIRAERDNQIATWGKQEHLAGTWLAILLEEVGEACRASLAGRPGVLRRELIHSAAVILAWLEDLAEERHVRSAAEVYTSEVLIERLIESSHD